MSNELEVQNIPKAVGALIVVLVFGTLGGFLFQMLQGMKFSKMGCIPAFTIKPLMKKVIIPNLLGMIIFGMIARNFFGEIMLHYPDQWTSYLRQVCLCLL